jgi:hypothetical protein
VLDSARVHEAIGFLEQALGLSIENDELVPANLGSSDRIAACVSRRSGGPGLQVPGAGGSGSSANSEVDGDVELEPVAEGEPPVVLRRAADGGVPR